MTQRRIVVTGIGIVSPLGIGKTNYWEALKCGQSGIRPITLFDVSRYNVKCGGEIFQFNWNQYFAKKGFNYIDRATALLLSASKLGLDDSQVLIDESNSLNIGVSIGTTFGSLQSLSDFDKESVVRGPQFVNPSRFPNTIANLPASNISIYFNIKGFNLTVSTGMCASLDAIDYAIKQIQFRGKRLVVSGAVEEMCEQTFLGFYILKFLSGYDGKNEPMSCPFDKRRNGIIFSEGSGVLILEDLDSAQKRSANIYAEIVGISSNFDSYRIHKYNPEVVGMSESMQCALKAAKLTPQEIDCIFANANSTFDADRLEAKAIKKVFGDYSHTVPVTSIKSMLGEAYSSAGIFSVIAAIGAIKDNFIPPLINYCFQDPDVDLNFVINQSNFTQEINTIMINSFGQNGASSTLILRKFI